MDDAADRGDSLQLNIFDWCDTAPERVIGTRCGRFYFQEHSSARFDLHDRGSLRQVHFRNRIIDFPHLSLVQPTALTSELHLKEKLVKRIYLMSCLALLLTFCSSGYAAPKKNIVETAVAAGDFKTLVTALKAAGLVDTLNRPGPFTVFAPTDAAFAKLPAGTVQDLLKPENKEKLVAILTYHVVAGDVTAKDVVKMTEAKTLNGKDVKISVQGGKVKINDATVVTADIACSNGVIHVIDSVLIPQ